MSKASPGFPRRALRSLYPTRLGTPKGLLMRALVLLLLYLGLHALGLRDYVTVFSLTSPSGAMGPLPILCGVSYALAYLGAVVVAPILTLAALLLAAAVAFGSRPNAEREAATDWRRRG